MNESYYDIGIKLKAEFKKSFTENSSDNTKFAFLRKFMMFVENDASSFNHLVVFENPLKNTERISFYKEFNQICRNFLDMNSKDNKNTECTKQRAKAICYIGMAYEYGLFNYSVDYYKSFQHYHLSAKMKYSLGCYKVAQSFENGRGVSREPGTALYFYRCAAKYGLTDALHTYGLILAKGEIGAEKDEKLGLHFLTRAYVQADEIYPYAAFDMGKWYETAKETLDSTVDPDYAFDIYTKGGNLDDPNCQFRIATCFEFGQLNQTIDFEKAMNWYLKAAEGGNLDAQIFLSKIYITGRGKQVLPDIKNAYKWTFEAATRLHAESLNYLGNFARTGATDDILLAMWWYMISATYGCADAKINYNETRAEVERIDDGPQIPKKCCSLFC